MKLDDRLTKAFEHKALSWFVPIFEGLARFMEENPGIIMVTWAVASTILIIFMKQEI